MTSPRPDAPLAGVRVLDLTNVLAGPFCAYLTIDGRRPTPDRPPPRLGEHGREPLRGAGLDDDAIDALVQAGVVATAADGGGQP